MQNVTHPELVAALVKNPLDIMTTLSQFSTDLWHGATGVAGETGELLEAFIFPGETGIDRVNLVEELGDIYFYVEQIVQRTGIHIDWEAIPGMADAIFPFGEGQVFFAGAIAVHGSQVLDTVKKASIYNKEIDLELLSNQLHALLACMHSLGRFFSITRLEALEANIAKLSKRYAGLSYSDKAAQERADKAEPQPVAERRFFGQQEHSEVLRAAGIPTDGDGSEHSEIMREITGH